jgi:hypothetical protein
MKYLEYIVNIFLRALAANKIISIFANFLDCYDPIRGKFQQASDAVAIYP